MRVLFTTQPGYGHLHPMLPTMWALQAAGHSVACASAPAFCPLIEGCGVPSLPAGIDWLESDAEQAFPELRTMLLEEQHTWFLSDLFADIAVHRMVPDLLKLCRDWQPDLIVSNDFEFGAPIAAEILGIPCATIGIDLFFPLPVKQQLLGAPLAYARSAHGLPPYPTVAMLYRWLYLSLIPPSFQFPEFALPATLHAMEPCAADHHAPAAAPPVPLPNDRPLIYATLGTVFNRVPAVFDAIIDGLADEPVAVIITTGRAQHMLAERALPPNITVAPYIPQEQLLPHCAMVITHGGFGTTMAALRHGLPLLAIPISAHQPFNAMRCASLGVGQVLRCPGQWSSHLGTTTPEVTPANLRAAVRAVLHDGRYRTAAERLQREIHGLPGPHGAVALLEQLAATRQPVLRQETARPHRPAPVASMPHFAVKG